MIAKASTVLSRAAKLIERGWTRDMLARDRNHWAVGALDKNAVEWCALGAIWRTVGDRDHPQVLPACDFLAKAIKVRSRYEIATWNNTIAKSKRQVVQAFLRAAKLAKAEGT